MYCRLANSTRRVAATLGLSRVPRDVTPSLGEYINARYGSDVEEVEL